VKLLSAKIKEVDHSTSSSTLGPLFQSFGRKNFKFSNETFFLGKPSTLILNLRSKKKIKRLEIAFFKVYFLQASVSKFSRRWNEVVRPAQNIWRKMGIHCEMF
jgi:hypothetical protein